MHFPGSRPVQDELLDFAWDREKCAIWASMGLGKTVTAATFIRDTLFDSFSATRWLIVAPRLVASDVWAKEFAKWPHLAGVGIRQLVATDFELEPGVVVYRDGNLVELAYSDMRPGDLVSLKRPEGVFQTPRFVQDKDSVLYDPRAKIVRTTGLQMPDRGTVKKRLLSYAEHVHVISYDFFPWLVKATGVNFPYEGIILDESTFVQSHRSERYRAAHKVINRQPGVRYVLELSGLPTPNGVEGLYSQFKLLDGGEALGEKLGDFREEWLAPDQTNRDGVIFSWKLRKSQEKRFHDALRTRAISASIDIGIPLVEVDQRVDMPAEGWQVYVDLENQLATQLQSGANVVAGSGGILRNKLMQVCNGAVYDANHVAHRIHLAKLELLKELAESLTHGVILAYRYAYDLPLLKAELGKYAMSSKEKGALDRFRRGQVKFLLTQPGSMSHGIDGLQGAGHNIVWFGAPDSLDHYAQLIARLHRNGQQAATVYVHRLFVPGTVEEDLVTQVLPGKASVDEAVRRGVLARVLARQ